VAEQVGRAATSAMKRGGARVGGSLAGGSGGQVGRPGGDEIWGGARVVEQQECREEHRR
jgi:hypothetical protein